MYIIIIIIIIYNLCSTAAPRLLIGEARSQVIFRLSSHVRVGPMTLMLNVFMLIGVVLRKLGDTLRDVERWVVGRGGGGVEEEVDCKETRQ